MQETPVEIRQGDTWNLTVAWLNPLPPNVLQPGQPPQPDPNNPIDITGYDAILAVCDDPADDPTPILTLTSNPAHGLTVNGPAGTVTVHATPAWTTTLPAGRRWWELQIANGTDTYTLANGPLSVLRQVITG